MITEMFVALKSIGVKDPEILAVVESLERRHDEYRNDMHLMGRDIAVLKWMVGIGWALLLPAIGYLVFRR